MSKPISRRSHTQRARYTSPGLAAILLALVAAASVYAVTLLLDGATGASAAPAPPTFLGEVASGEVPAGEFSLRNGLAVESATGDVYVSTNERLLELSPYGAFVREIGHEVDLTEVAKREAQEAAKEPVTVTSLEEDVCTAASGDKCGTGKSYGNDLGGAIENPRGVALEQSTGAIYVINDRAHGRVDRFAKDGSFVWALGNRVDRTKVELREKEEAKSEPVTVTTEEEDLCTAASHDECQPGERGSGAPGEFAAEIARDDIAVGGPSEHLFVGDKGRIRVFDSEGHQVGEDSLSSLSATGSVSSVTADAAGDVFFEESGVAGVHELEPGGSLSSNVYDAASTRVRTLAVDGSGHLFVGDTTSSPRMLEYEVANPGASPAEFGTSEPGELREAEAVAVDSAGTVYVGNGQALSMFGSLATMEPVFGAPPKLAPTIGAENAVGAVEVPEVTLRANVNPQLSATTYQFQYGLEPCSSGHCVSVPASPASLGTVAKAPFSVSAMAMGLTLGQVYDFRVVASNAAGVSYGPEAEFTVGRSNIAGEPGLPDGRRYELVSPADKNGNSVYPSEEFQAYSVASEEGNAILFQGSGAMGSANASLQGNYVAMRTGSGWSTAAAVGPPLSAEGKGEGTFYGPEQVIPSKSFSQFLFMAQHAPYSHEEPLGPEASVNIFLSQAPGAEPLWLGKPAIGDPIPAPGHVGFNTYELDGASADLSTVYFSAAGTLVPEDAARASHVGNANGDGHEPWGFYEWHDGLLSSAGVLPDGSVSPWGAVPPHLIKGGFLSDGSMPDYFNNQVSEDGTKAFFISPDPSASSVSNPETCNEKANLGTCTSEAPQLYVRETLPDGTKRTVLVSQSQLPGSEGRPSAHGPLAFEDPLGAPGSENIKSESYVYATPDGRQAFFFSVDRLTSAAPSNEEAKMYDFDTETETLTYLPDVNGPIAAVAPNDSDFIFEDKAESPDVLKLWTAGPNGGSVRVIAQLPIPANAEYEEEHYNVDNARASEDGSVFVFGTNAQIPGGFNDGGGFWQLYRYSVASGELACASCPPRGQAPVGNAEASYANSSTTTAFGAHSTINTRIMSGNGDRVFFDTPNALVAQDTNGKRDVYEWENGRVYLISAGTGSENSFVMDSSASGSDVFFSTSVGLVPQDTDGAYDVYDARIPHPGDNPPPSAVPCEGPVCQGPASTPELLGAPASATFSGAGNVTPTLAKQVVQQTAKKHKTSRRNKKRTRKRRRSSKGRKSAAQRTRSRASRVPRDDRGHGRNGRGK